MEIGYNNVTGELNFDLEAGGLFGGFKNGELICVMTINPDSTGSIPALEALGYEVHQITEDVVDKAQREVYDQMMDERYAALAEMQSNMSFDNLIFDDVLCPYDRTERKRRGKRKNANPYQSTMKRGR